jgi:imidazolonepropionase-like amidohydrolase
MKKLLHCRARLRALAGCVAIVAGFSAADATLAEESDKTLFKNVSVFDGKNNKLHENMNVLVEGNTIKSVSSKAISAAGAQLINGGGRTLMPGMIDAHVHIMMNNDYAALERDLDAIDIAIGSTVAARDFLMDGFTTIRDMGGPAFGLKRQIDNGTIVGPRVYPSGAFLSQTSGHGDFRDRGDVGFSPETSHDYANFTKLGIGTVTDGVPAVLRATRVNLRNGATQIKIMAGGGGSSKYDPIDTTQLSKEEMCAAVEAAADWGTYVAAHIFNDRAMNRALDCGVKSFEHAFFASKETYKRIAKEGGFVVPQMWGLSPELANNPLMPPAKIPMVRQLGETYKNVGCDMLAAKVNVAFMSDWVGVIEDANRSRRF